MRLNEEQELQSVNNDFEYALKMFRKGDFKQAEVLFSSLIEKYKDSDSYSVQEVHARSKVYRGISHGRLNPIQHIPQSLDEFISEATFQLNAGRPEEALLILAKVDKKNSTNPELLFLSALAHYHQGDIPTALANLSQAISQDSHYKVLAFNEPDFEALQSNPDFLSIVE